MNPIDIAKQCIAANEKGHCVSYPSDAVALYEISKALVEADFAFQNTDINLKIKQTLRDRLEEAERERDEMNGALKASSDNAVTWMKRALKAEIEIARRDAAAGEAVHLYREHNPCNGMKTDWIEIDSEQLASLRENTDPETAEFRTLHDAAPPAVLPDIDKYTHGLWPHAVEQLIRFRDDALALGAQPQKPVVIPDLPHDCDRTEAHFKYIAALDAAGIPYELKP